MKMNENKSEINNIYKEIGKKVYEKHVANENIDIKTELEEECTKIDVLSAEIETCLKSILELKEKKQCEQCHTEIDLDATFCPKCGAKQPEIEVKEAEVVGVDVENDDNNDNNNNDADEHIETKNTENTSNESEVASNTDNLDNSDNSASEENTVEKVTEVMSVETQENAKEETNNEQQY